MAAQQRNTDGGADRYRHFADIEVRLADTKGQNDNLWDSAYYEGRELSFTVNGTLASGTIQNGMLAYSMQIDGVDKAVLEIDVSSLSERFCIRQPGSIFFAPPADPIPETEPEINYLPLWIILTALLLALTVLLIFQKDYNSDLFGNGFNI